MLVSLAVYGLARWQPFAPGAPAAAQVAGGDATAGEAVFARSCAVCHGTSAEGGVGPALAGRGLSAEAVAGVVAAGRGIMPAGLVEGTEAADVAAYVASISGGGGAATTPSPTATAPQAAGGGSARLTGARLTGLVVTLDAPAPADWTIWIEGPAGRETVGAIAQGGRRSARVPVAPDGLAFIGRYDTVLVGASAEAPALRGALAADRAGDLRSLFLGDPGTAGDAPALDAAAGQIAVLHDHVRFLAAARDEGNLANVRFHGEHMVNITRGAPLRDVDGNGEASNPGDGLGLIDGPDAHLRRVGALIGPALTDKDRAAAAEAAVIARQGGVAGTTGSVAAAVPAVAAIQAADARLDAAWAALRADAARAAVIDLGPP